jgi:hypothetical protein
MLKEIKLHYFLKKISLLMLLFSSSFLASSCFRDPVNLDLSEYGPNIVIEGSIANRPGPHSVRITQTTAYKGQNNFPAVRGAEVTIGDDLGNLFVFQETEAGLYQAFNLAGQPGKTYTLSILADGKKYTATSTMPLPLILKTINLSRVAPGADVFELSFSFQDHPGIEDYCLITIYSNGEKYDHFLYQDKSTDGEEVIFDDINAYFYYGNVVTIEVITFDRAGYEFYNSIDMINDREEDDEIVGNFVPVTTFNPTTNLNNGALGYFGANAIGIYSRTVN